MRALAALWLMLFGLIPLLSGATLQEARLRWLKGNYEEAQSLYEDLLKDAKVSVPAAIGLSRVLQSQGEYDRALEVIVTALKSQPKEADLLARQAELLHLRGRFDEADKAVAAALASNDKHILALWVRAQLFRDRGQFKAADTEVKRIVRLYSEGVNTPNEIKDAEQLVLIGQASAENARWNGIADEFQAILEDLYGDAIKFDKNYWPAELQAGLLLLEKYNRGEALEAIDKALTINPSAAEALTARGLIALGRFEMKEAERFAERALKVNPRLPEALRLRADVHLATGDVTSALKELQQALQVNPRDELTLARVAACHHLLGDNKAFDAVVAAVEQRNPRPAVFYFALGERLEERRRFSLAERFFQQAAKAWPELPGPANALGLLYMRLGREKEAAELLEKGFQADRFNVRVSNMRKVLQHLSEYKEIRTRHFLVRYDPRRDAALARYMAETLEDIYEDLANKFAYRPEGPIPVELFRSHNMFSGRTVALPDLHTIGACTGKVITLVSPNEKNSKGEPVRKPFNWGRVLRHEVVHIFNLAQTNFLVPHWFTEGLAVSNEGFPRPPSWNQMLIDRVTAAGKQGDAPTLLNLDTIDLGFIRPRDPMEWQLAYCQAQLYVEYIEKTHGDKAIGQMLAAFAAGKNVTQALKEVCGVERAEFEKGYRDYLEKLVAELRGKRAGEKRRTLKELQAEYKKNPRDADVAGELALRLLNTQRAEARKLAEAALEVKADQPRALYVLARLAERAADTKQARQYLERALNRENPEPMVVKSLARLYYDNGEFTRAADVLESLRKHEPNDREVLQELARVYARMEAPDKQISVLQALVPMDADDFDRRARLARLLSEQNNHAAAEKAARQALEIDVTSKEVREILYRSLRGQNKNAELKRVQELLADN